MLSVENFSPFSHIDFGSALSRDAMADVVVAKARYALVPNPEGADDTFELRHDPGPDVLNFTERAFGDINSSSMRYESDLAPFKPRCDVVVIGTAHTPVGRPVRAIEVGVEISHGEAKILEHSLMVYGPRDLVKHDAFDRSAAAIVRAASFGTVNAPRWFIDEPALFESAPVRYELAFGGQLKIYAADEAADRLDESCKLSAEIRARHPEGDDAPLAHRTCRVNPVGSGYVEIWHIGATRAKRYPAPRIEAKGAPFTAELFEALLRKEIEPGANVALLPQGLGLIAKSWHPRLALAGTYDEAWRRDVWPYSPADFDDAFWNGANPAMRCDYLAGGERVVLRNLLPHEAKGTRHDGGATITQFSLPKTELVIRLQRSEGPRAYVKLPIDTLTIDLDAMTVSTVWRLRIPEASKVTSAALMVVDVEKGRQRLARAAAE
jgi:hypothetical protein